MVCLKYPLQQPWLPHSVSHVSLFHATGAASNDILMLEAPAQGPSWPGPLTNAEIIDALPYIDEEYSSAAVKNEVDLMVEEELRRSTKKPADFLKELPPLTKPDFKNNPVLAREYDRVRASKPPVVLDFSRDKAEMPRRTDEALGDKLFRRLSAIHSTTSSEFFTFHSW